MWEGMSWKRKKRRNSWLFIKEKTLIRILFVCHGNICRSAAAEQIMKHIVRENKRDNMFLIDSAATSTEEIGNPMYPPMQKVLNTHGIPVGNHRARKLVFDDGEEFDLLIGFDDENMHYIRRICSDRFEDKYHRMTEYIGEDSEIEDPWYSGNYEKVFRKIYDSCCGLMEEVLKNMGC